MIIKTVLVVGLGSIGKRHLRLLRSQYLDIRLVLLRHNECKADDVESFGLSKCTSTIEEALELNLDAAIIATPATNHIEVALTLAKAGVHLFIEKPISTNSEDVQPLIQLCQQKKIVLMTGYNLRFQPSLQEFRKQIQCNKIGKILSVRAEVGQYLPGWRPGSDYRKSVSAQKKLGGGVLLELSHEIDYIGWVFGDYLWVKAHLSKQSDLEIDVEDSANIIFGVVINKEKEITGSLNMDFIRHDDTRICLAIGDQGSLKWDGINGQVYWFSKDRNEWELIFEESTERDFTYIKEIDHFFSSIKRKEGVMISGKDGLKVVRCVEAIRHSHERNSLVVL